MGLPPNQTKGNGESSFLTTFKVDYDKTPVTRTGVEIKIGTTPISMGGTGSTTKNFVDLTTNQTIAGVKTFSSTIAGSVSGNSATVTTNANLTGEVTSIGNAATITNDAVIAKTLTGYVAAPGVIAPADTILTALQKVDGNVTAKTLQNVYEASTSPQVVTSATKGALNLKRGSALDSDAVLKVLNGAGDDVASIDGLGNLKANNVVITNYIQDPKCERVITTAIPYNTRVGTPAIDKNPTTGTGGTSSLTVSNSTSIPLSGLRSLLVVKPASDIQGHGFSIPFTIERTQINKPLQISMYYEIASGTYADGDLTWWVIPDGANPIQPAPTKLMNVIGVENFFGEFQTTSALSYKLVCHVSSQSALAYSLKFDNFFVGVSAKLYGSPITDWKPTSLIVEGLGSGGVSENLFYYKQVGDTLELKGHIRKDGTNGTGSAAITFTLPFSLSIDSSKNNNSILGVVGIGVTLNLAPNGTARQAYAFSSTKIALLSASGGTNVVGSNLLASDYLNVKFSVPILGWSSSTLLSSDADTRVIAAQYTSCTPISVPQSSPVTTIKFQTLQNDTHGAYNTSTGLYKCPVQGFYRVRIQADYGGTSSSLWYLVIQKNGLSVSGTASNFQNTSLINSSLGTVYCNAGDLLSGTLQYAGSGAGTGSISGLDDRVGLSIERISGPSQIAASESVSALYRGAPPTGTLNTSWNAVKFGTKVKDSHGAYNPTTGIYKVPQSGTYTLLSSIDVDATYVVDGYAALRCSIGGTEIVGGVDRNTTAGGRFQTLRAQFAITSLPLLEGTEILLEVAISETTGSYGATGTRNFFSITRTGNF